MALALGGNGEAPAGNRPPFRRAGQQRRVTVVQVDKTHLGLLGSVEAIESLHGFENLGVRECADVRQFVAIERGVKKRDLRIGNQ